MWGIRIYRQGIDLAGGPPDEKITLGFNGFEHQIVR